MLSQNNRRKPRLRFRGRMFREMSLCAPPPVQQKGDLPLAVVLQPEKKRQPRRLQKQTAYSVNTVRTGCPVSRRWFLAS